VSPSPRHPSLRHLVVDSPLGPLTLVADPGDALAGVYLWNHSPAPRPAALGEPVAGGDPALHRIAVAVTDYLEGRTRHIDVPLAPVPGTAFQHAVWAEVAAIPYGATRSYGQVAAAVGRPGATRAVGSANARNPRCLVVPCHRVVSGSGALTGYAGGVEAKRWLLDLESRGAVTAAG